MIRPCTKDCNSLLIKLAEKHTLQMYLLMADKNLSKRNALNIRYLVMQEI